MQFRLEYEMIPIIKTNINSLFDTSSDTMACAEELPVNFRKVDLAFALMNRDHIRIIDNLSLKKAFKKLNMMQLDVLSLFYQTQGKVSIHKLTKILKIKPEEVKKLYLNQFLELDLINQVTKFCYCATNWIEISPAYVIAIEAKLSKWKEALNQAVYNLKFADYSYVALDEDICREKITKVFADQNIGFISVNARGILHILHKPQQNKLVVSSDFNLQRVRICRDLICQNSKWAIMVS